MKVKFFLVTAMVLLFSCAAFAQSATCNGMSTGAGASLNGFGESGGICFDGLHFLVSIF